MTEQKCTKDEIKAVRTDLAVWLADKPRAIRAIGASISGGLTAVLLHGAVPHSSIISQLAEDVARLKIACLAR